MNAEKRAQILRQMRFGRRRHQSGTETVEFALIGLLFFLFLFLIIDMTIMMYDIQVIHHAARYSARQGTLFWMNPSDYDVKDPARIKENMITDAIAYFTNNSVMIKAASSTLNSTYKIFDSADQLCDISNPTCKKNNSNIWLGISNAKVDIEINYTHHLFGISKVFNYDKQNRKSVTALRVEANY